MISSHEQRRVKSTTWPSRHRDAFNRFVQCLSQLQTHTPTVLEVGPGAATKFLAPFYPDPDDGDGSRWLKARWRALIRKTDSLLRCIPGIELHSFEPGELQRVLPANVDFHVADISKEVIKAVQKQYPNLHARLHDFSCDTFPIRVDAIICICVLVRAKEGKKLFENLYNSLEPGGLLVMDNRSVRSFGGPEYPLECLSNQLFRKI